jgi:hypothetical protein
MSEMTAEEQREARRAEFGKYVAKGPIDIGGVRAFNKDDAVPAGHVDGYDRPILEPTGDGDLVDSGRTEHIDPVVDRSLVDEVGASSPAEKPSKTEKPES